ncbi:hypothetical protein GCM10017771_81640 [Streptomyces capitiformicae]|uniref:Uncharacterized protein n=1 Tax=Streptomyces capitiformicae TaxID=2014920 RepID=A0A918ZME3_9ACTN|nr:hypothetical protein GCM10017771_81640 [Streptomyces capitiformicae]
MCSWDLRAGEGRGEEPPPLRGRSAPSLGRRDAHVTARDTLDMWRAATHHGRSRKARDIVRIAWTDTVATLLA